MLVLKKSREVAFDDRWDRWNPRVTDAALPSSYPTSTDPIWVESMTPRFESPRKFAREFLSPIGIPDRHGPGGVQMDRRPHRCKMLARGDIVLELDIQSPLRQSSLVEIGRLQREPGIDHPLQLRPRRPERRVPLGKHLIELAESRSSDQSGGEKVSEPALQLQPQTWEVTRSSSANRCPVRRSLLGPKKRFGTYR